MICDWCIKGRQLPGPSLSSISRGGTSPRPKIQVLCKLPGTSTYCVRLCPMFVCPLIDGRCEPVPEVINAVPESHLALQGVVVRYSCIEGYTLKMASSGMILCDGQQWSSPLPECEGQ